MKILLIGDANHQYNLSFCKWLKKTVNCEVSAIDFKSSPESKGNYDSFYPLNGKKTLLNTKWVGSVYRSILVKRIIKKNNLGKDIIILQSAIPWIAGISKYLKNRSNNFVIAFWGSDFYRYKRRNVLRKLISNAHNIIIGSPQMISDFNTEFGDLNLKTNLCYFGNEPIENLKVLKENNTSRQESFKTLGLNEFQINVVIGHNGSIHNKHIEVIESIKKSVIDKDVNVILPMTYGASTEYLKQVNYKCKSSLKNFTILTDFMTEQKIAHLRNISDIMVNVQTTDAFSGSMREVMYSGGIMINGSWLPYEFLKKEGVYFEEVESTLMIGDKVNLIIQNFNSFSKKAENNSEKIYELSSWSKTIKAWAQVLNR